MINFINMKMDRNESKESGGGKLGLRELGLVALGFGILVKSSQLIIHVSDVAADWVSSKLGIAVDLSSSIDVFIPKILAEATCLAPLVIGFGVLALSGKKT